jgi:hypothetical protein
MRPLGEQQPAEHGSPHPLLPLLLVLLDEVVPPLLLDVPPQLVTNFSVEVARAAQPAASFCVQRQRVMPWLGPCKQHDPLHEDTRVPPDSRSSRSASAPV